VFVTEGDLHGVEDFMYEMNDVMGEWCFIESAIYDDERAEVPESLARVIQPNDVDVTDQSS